MKKWSILVVILALAILLMVMGWGVRAQSSSRVTWEYRVITTYGSPMSNPPLNMHQLNEAGAEGWELLTIHSEEYPKPGAAQFKTDYFFKRAK